MTELSLGQVGALCLSEALMRHTGNFHPEWGYLAPAPQFLRRLRLVVLASVVAATASAAVVVALVRQPAAEASVATRTLVPPPDASPAPPALALIDSPVHADHIATPAVGHVSGLTRQESTHMAAAHESAIANAGRIVAVPRQEADPVASEAAKPAAIRPSARSAPEIAAVPAVAAAAKTADASRTSNKTIRNAPPAKPNALRVRMASAQHPGKPIAHPPLNMDAREAAPNRAKTARYDDPLLTKTMDVTNHVIAATQRAVSTIGVVPSWIGSIGNRLGG
jgi:hypothetical protein